MNAISIKGYKLNLNFEPQLSPQGKEMRLSGISIVTTEPKVWDNEKKMYLHGTIYSFRYLGTDTFVSFKFDAKGNFVCKM